MEKQSLLELVRQQLQLVEPPSSGHSTQTVYDGGSQQVLRQTLIVLAAGQSLEEHLDMGEGTVQVLHGQVRLTAGDDSWHGSPGDLLTVPRSWHSLEALETSAVLVTVASSPT